jgi:SAM-dependent methyltransferase
MPAGSGPGVITADGCAVEVYAAMPAGDEPDLIDAAVRSGGSLLELGAGAGRVTAPLVERGYDVVAVDDSAEMLAHVHGAQTVVASIEGLDLGRRFDGVLLCSHLINTSDPAQREAFLAACARHVAPDGCVVIERHTPQWFDEAAESTFEHDGIRIGLRDLSRPGPDLLAATVHYAIGDRVWTQTFVAQRVDDGLLVELLGQFGLAVDRYLDEDRAWVRAVPRREGED